MVKHNKIIFILLFLSNLVNASAGYYNIGYLCSRNPSRCIKYNGTWYLVGTGVCVCTAQLNQSFQQMKQEIFTQNIEPIINGLTTSNQLVNYQILQEKSILQNLNKELKLEFFRAKELQKQSNDTANIK